MASINVILFNSKTLKNGEHPIMLRIIKDRKTNYTSIGHSSSKINWDSKKGLPNKKHPNYFELMILIDTKRAEANKTLMKLETDDTYFDSEILKNKLTKINKSVSVIFYLDSVIKELVYTDRVGNSKVYADLKRVLKNYLNGKDLVFQGINVTFLKNLELHFNVLKFKPNTMNLYFRTLRATIKKAIQDDIIDASKNPFGEFSFSKLKNDTKKRAISRAEIKKIESLDTSGDISLKLAQDYFMFSYYCSGMNFKDFSLLKGSNIESSDTGIYVTYIRSKTKKLFVVKLLPQVISILDRYNFKLDIDNYIFPVLDNKNHIQPMTISNRLKKVSTQVNKNLKVLAQMAGIDPNITTYTSRHTFATVLKKTGQSTAIISEMMGHKSESITQVYLDSFDNEKLYEASLSL